MKVDTADTEKMICTMKKCIIFREISLFPFIPLNHWVNDLGNQHSFDTQLDLDWTPSMPLASFNLAGFDMSDGVYVIWRPEPDIDL